MILVSIAIEQIKGAEQMDIKLFDSELKVMEILWRSGDTTAKDIAQQLSGVVGWSKTTTYTVIKKCIDKGAIERVGTNFLCRALVSISQVREYETDELINKLYDGCADQLVASLLGKRHLSREEIDGLRKLIEELE